MGMKYLVIIPYNAGMSSTLRIVRLSFPILVPGDVDVHGEF